MKTLNLLLILTLTAITSITVNAFSQTQGEKTKEIHINKKGEVHDHGWNKLGYIDKNDIVRDNKGRKVYFIDQNGNVIDGNGKNLGKAQKNGNYYNLKGENVVLVRDVNQEMCEILDPKGHKLGTVHQNYKLHACATHCFWLNKKKEQASK